MVTQTLHDRGGIEVHEERLADDALFHRAETVFRNAQPESNSAFLGCKVWRASDGAPNHGLPYRRR